MSVQTVKKNLSATVICYDCDLRNEFFRHFAGLDSLITPATSYSRVVVLGEEQTNVDLYDSAIASKSVSANADAFICLFDATVRSSYENVEQMVLEARNCAAKSPKGEREIFIVALQSSTKKNLITKNEANALGDHLKCTYAELRQDFDHLVVNCLFSSLFAKKDQSKPIATPAAPTLRATASTEFFKKEGSSKMAGGGGVLSVLAKMQGLGKRGKVAFEILMSEKSYCSTLEHVVKNFLEPLIKKTEKDVSITKEQIMSIFFNIEAILFANKKFYDDLYRHLNAPNFKEEEPMIGMFENLLPSLAHYPDYVKNQWNAIITVNKKERSEVSFAQFLKRAKDKGESKLDLLSCLIQPVQRVPRYGLLLADLIKSTPDTHSDYKTLSELNKEVNDIATKVNEDMQKQENFKIVVAIQKAFGGQIKIAIPELRDTRQYIRDGTLLKKVRYGTNQSRHFFLFTDMMLYAKASSLPDEYMYKGLTFGLRRFLSNVQAVDCNDTAHPNSFQITSKEKSFIVEAQTPQEKEAWIRDIKKAAQNSSGGAHAPIWQADTTTKQCTLCKHEFTFTNRRHHCRNCGRVICGHCSANKAKLPHLQISDDPVRVCTDCHSKLGLKKQPQIFGNTQQNSASQLVTTISTQITFSQSQPSLIPSTSPKLPQISSAPSPVSQPQSLGIASLVLEENKTPPQSKTINPFLDENYSSEEDEDEDNPFASSNTKGTEEFEGSSSDDENPFGVKTNPFAKK